METEQKLDEVSQDGNDDRMSKYVGTLEPKKLQPVKVKVVSAKIEVQKKKSGEVIGDILNLYCKHPENEELIKISKVKFEKDGKLKESGLWYNEDSEKNIMKGSALAILLGHYGCANVSAIEVLELDTVANEQGYLIIKAY